MKIYISKRHNAPFIIKNGRRVYVWIASNGTVVPTAWNKNK